MPLRSINKHGTDWKVILEASLLTDPDEKFPKLGLRPQGPLMEERSWAWKRGCKPTSLGTADVDRLMVTSRGSPWNTLFPHLLPQKQKLEQVLKLTKTSLFTLCCCFFKSRSLEMSPRWLGRWEQGKLWREGCGTRRRGGEAGLWETGSAKQKQDSTVSVGRDGGFLRL